MRGPENKSQNTNRPGKKARRPQRRSWAQRAFPLEGPELPWAVGSKSPLWGGRHGGSKRSRNEADGILIARQMAWEKRRIFFFSNAGKHFNSFPSIKTKWEPSVLGRFITIISTVRLGVFFLIIAWLSNNNKTRIVFSNKLGGSG